MHKDEKKADPATNKYEIQIPPYMDTDFYNSTAPFDFLYQHIGDPVLFNQLKQRMAEHAKKVGVKGFAAILKGFLVKKANAVTADYNNLTDCSRQPAPMFCYKYKCDDMGISKVDRYGTVQPVSNTPVLPVKRLVNIDTKAVKLELLFRRDMRWERITVKRDVIASAQRILELSAYGIDVRSSNASDLSDFIITIEQANMDQIEYVDSTSRLGWIDNPDGSLSFAPFTEDLFFDGDELTNPLFRAIHTRGSYDEWLQTVKTLRKEHTPARFFLAASFSSVLIRRLHAQLFGVHAYGESEVGKSVGLMLAASVWGDPNIGKYCISYNSTSVGLEMSAILLNDMPLCIDELQIKESSGEKDFDSLIYKLCEGRGKTRGAKNGGLQPVGTWSNCFISTGERPITNRNSKGGSLNRVVEFECTEKISADLPGLASALRKNYGWAGRVFTDLLKDDGVIAMAEELFAAYAADLQGRNSTAKQANAIALLLTADTMITNAIFHDDQFLTVDDFIDSMKMNDEISQSRRAYEMLKELPVRYAKNFEPDKMGEYKAECWGKVENDKLYLIRGVFDQLMNDAGYDSSMFLGWASRTGILAATDAAGSRYTKVVRFRQQTSRCVVIWLDHR